MVDAVNKITVKRTDASLDSAIVVEKTKFDTKVATKIEGGSVIMELKEVPKAKPSKKKVSKKAAEKKVINLPSTSSQHTESEIQAKPVIKTAELTPTTASAKTENVNQKSGWKSFTDSLKQGQERVCTQAEITMNQYHQ